MNDRISELKTAIAEDPASLAFFELAASLRASGDLAGAERVVEAGLARHPGHSDARSLYGEILLDRGKLIEAFQQWAEVIETDPRDLPANKGLGFLYYKGGQFDQALDHLEVALSVDPTDTQVRAAFFKVREALENVAARPAQNEEQTAAPAGRGEPADTMLADSRGRPLTGAIEDGRNDVSEQVAAYVVSVADEASRTSRMLGLGNWQWITCESPQGCMHISQPSGDSHLILVGKRGTRPAEIEMRAEAATESARGWLEKSRG